MSLVSSVQSKTLTKSFALDIPNFLLQAGSISKAYKRISSPDFFFDGLENEKYEGKIIVANKDGGCFGEIGFSVELSRLGCDSPQVPVDIASTISVSKRDAKTAAFVSTFGEARYYGNISNDSSTFSACRPKDFYDMKNYYKDHDEARVSVSLTMLYTSDNYADWKLENSLVRVSGDSIPPARPSYEKPLAERKKTDITVACGGREFPVHSVVLTLVSPVFERMLETNMKEAASKRITIIDVESEAVERTVNFIYTGKLFSQADRPSDNSIIQLLHCAEKYAIADMKKEVLNQMVCRLTVNNAIRFVDAMKTYNGDKASVAKVLEFSKKNLSLFRKDSAFEKFLLRNIQALI